MSPDDVSSTGSENAKTLHQDEQSSYLSGYPSYHHGSPSSKSPGIDIPYGLTRGLRPRRSSLTLSFDQLRHVGGVNSIENFARSWTRAAGYLEVTPSRQSYVDIDSLRGEDDLESHPDSALFDDDVDLVPSEYTSLHPSVPSTTYGSLSSLARGAVPIERLNDSASRHAADLFVEQQQSMLQGEATDKEREPLLVKTVATEEGVVQQVIVGQSTLPQTVFNSVNVLIGIGLLSLPLGLKYSGWVIGMTFLAFSAIVTNYTAKLLARCLERSPNQALVTYSDIAYIAFGHRSRILVSILFSLELVAACVALVVLFADSLHDLIPSVSVLAWKIIAGIVLTPLSFLPLRVLSFSSILGIFSTVSIFVIVAINGLLKPEFPGSLLDPAPTYLFPKSWLTVPLSFGLLMSPWGGHGVFPNIFKDMRHPDKYNRAVNITYWFTYLLDASMMVVGILMFGDGVKDEITANILAMTGYPKGTKVAMVIFIAIIPLTKTPLNARPIISTLEVVFGVDGRSVASPAMSGFSSGLVKILIRVLTNVVFVVMAVIFPGFDTIMAFLGSALCFTICVILPLMFYLKIFGDEISMRERILDYALVVISTVLAIIGTAFTFIPKEKIGA